MDRLFSKPSIIQKSKRSHMEQGSSVLSYGSGIGHSASLPKYIETPVIYIFPNNHIQEIQVYLDRRVQYLAEQITKVVNHVQSDELVKTLQEDELTSKFTFERVKEIICKVLQSDQEAMLEELAYSSHNLKSQNEALLFNIGELQKDLQQKENELDQERKQMVHMEHELMVQRKQVPQHQPTRQTQQLAEKLEELKMYQNQLEKDLKERVPLKEHLRLMEERNMELKSKEQGHLMDDKLSTINTQIQNTISTSVSHLKNSLCRNFSKGLKVLVSQQQLDRERIQALSDQLKESQNNELSLIRMNKVYQEQIDVLAEKASHRSRGTFRSESNKGLGNYEKDLQNSHSLSRGQFIPQRDLQSTDHRSHSKVRSQQSYRAMIRDSSPLTTQFFDSSRNALTQH